MGEPRVNSQPLWVRALLDKDLPPTERIVLVALAWHQGSNGTCWPSEKALAAELGLSERHIRRVIQNLTIQGRVRVARPASQGRGMSNTYVVTPAAKGGHVDPPFEGQKADTAVPLSDKEGGHPGSERGTRMSSQHRRNTSGGGGTTTFTPPTEAQVDEYALSIGYVKPGFGLRFIQHYEATGWRIKDGSRMENWKLAVQTWRRMDERNGAGGTASPMQPEPQPDDYIPTVEELEARKLAWQAGGNG